ncbi:MAG: Gfo/Idh/MocA family oxidoreductase [Planctomycetota bacterium]|nr:Gfo/Idh/MocA family oxidoreductase [Planctomycetota bacterium]MDA0934634.1 Gfo/Idh/MocA family oxidoreductase [Planctomycetota bacterium]MDA1220638.1 Gfo/Idh/MocA family oxidoreductase [Planctomycetota bacterium]
MPESLDLALIGAGGRIAGDWLAVANHADSPFRITKLVETETVARARLGALPDLDALLEGERPAAAIVATPPATHADIAVRLAEAGVHILCEKPLATTLADAEAMVHAARAAGVRLMMASKFRFVDDVAEASKRIAEGAIGQPVFYDNAFCGHVDMGTRWNSDARISGGGVLIDNGAHAIDLARFLMGEVERVLAATGPRLQPVEVEDSVRILFETCSGALGRADLSWSVDIGSTSYAAVHGSEGSIELGWKGARLRTREGWLPFGGGYDKHRAFGNQLAHFADVIRGAADPRIGDDDALASVRFVDAARRSLREGRWCRLTEVHA